MPTAFDPYPSKTSWRLELDYSEGTLDAVLNRSFVNWSLWLKRGNSDTPFNNSASAWSVGGPVGAAGSFGAYRFGGSGTGTNYSATPVGGRVLIASGGDWVNHNPNGTGSVSLSASHAAASTLGTASIPSFTFTLTTLKVVPTACTSVVATRISDTQIGLTWVNNGASNGQPTTNTIQTSVNGAAYSTVATISVATSLTISALPNQKVEVKVRGNNTAGSGAFGVAAAPVYTTPADPTSAVAIKNSSLDIDLTFTPNVGYTEHIHEVWHGVVVAGVTTWDGSPLASLASGDNTYTDVAPNPAQVHQYRVRAVSSAGALASGYAISNSVQLLAAPNKPTVPALAAFADKAATFRFPWVHNPVDSTAQTKRQVRYSLDGGGIWTTGAKTADTNEYLDFAASTWVANDTVTFQVRTKGQYDSGADGDASYSPWSDSVSVTFKTKPVATITSPVDGATLTESILRATVGFSQAEAATFVKAQLELMHGVTLQESLESVIQVGITFATPVLNGESYVVRARVQDSNGIWSAWVENDFDVDYLAPVAAGVVVTFLPDTGYGQLELTIPAAGVGEDDAATVTILRTIDGVTETIVTDYPVEALMTFLDTTPVTHGTNTYTIITTSALGAQTTVVEDLVTEECRRAYLSKGASFDTGVVFGGNLAVSEALSVASDTIQAAGRTKPIGLYGTETAVQLKVSSFIFEGFGSGIDDIRDLLLLPGKACYRDASGRRVFGSVRGGVAYKKTTRGDMTFTLIETS